MRSRLVLKALVIVLLLAPLSLVAVPSAAAPAEAPSHNVVYIVQPGDTLFSIARRFGVSVASIAMANNIVNPNLIYAGQRLVIPTGYAPPYKPVYAPPAATVYIVKPGDTLFSIALRFGTTVQAIALANNIANPNVIFVGQRLIIPKAAPLVVKKVIKKVIVVTPPPPPLQPAACDPSVSITFPRQGEVLDGLGTHFVTGTASIDDFQFYKLEFGFGPAPIKFFSIDEVQRKPVVNGILGAWNTGALPDGTYTLRLTVVDNRGQFPPPCDVVVTVRHDP
jgi:LysM repeat protein